MKAIWWKILAVVLLLYIIIAGFLMEVPRVVDLNESIRNLYFHVPMWFTMFFICTAGAVYSVLYLAKFNLRYDNISNSLVTIGVLFGLFGYATGYEWASFTWAKDVKGIEVLKILMIEPKMRFAAIALLVYGAYFVLRNSVDEVSMRARLSSIYNIFAFATLIPLLYILPNSAEFSLHPGGSESPAFNSYDLDQRMRIIFYPAILGWTLLGGW
ncbi:MAG: cytochrome c biogenesis protein CcsA, partial [Bacteroidetes bacterium]|nr:cytochrome c biogenesis protein CcsA [Bacteroidota bacterium]